MKPPGLSLLQLMYIQHQVDLVLQRSGDPVGRMGEPAAAELMLQGEQHLLGPDFCPGFKIDTD